MAGKDQHGTPEFLGAQAELLARPSQVRSQRTALALERAEGNVAHHAALVAARRKRLVALVRQRRKRWRRGSPGSGSETSNPVEMLLEHKPKTQSTRTPHVIPAMALNSTCTIEVGTDNYLYAGKIRVSGESNKGWTLNGYPYPAKPPQICDISSAI